jgi:hypothetical protein
MMMSPSRNEGAKDGESARSLETDSSAWLRSASLLRTR